MATTVINPNVRGRDKRGRYMAGAPIYPAALIANEKRRRGREWRKFRENFLYSQDHLAQALGISRRTVTSVEAGKVIPALRIQRAFRDLVKAEKERAA